ncbi:hypothetical protein ACC736_40130, partial [Rhizobium ruizarguesonis]
PAARARQRAIFGEFRLDLVDQFAPPLRADAFFVFADNRVQRNASSVDLLLSGLLLLRCVHEKVLPIDEFQTEEVVL